MIASTMLAAMTLALSYAPEAQASCGCMLTPTPQQQGVVDSRAYNHGNLVVIQRSGTTTTLTMANDFVGEFTEFALVVPVPGLLDREDISLVHPDHLTALDRFTAPQLLQYDCSDFGVGGGGCAGGGTVMNDMAMAPSEDGGEGSVGGVRSDIVGDTVQVEASYEVGEYDVDLLSAEESADLLRWLDGHGYEVPDDAADLLQDYIDGGQYFLAARVQLDEIPEDRSWIYPLRIRYEADAFALPLRLGTVNSEGIQDLTVLAIGAWEDGDLSIANYAPVEVETNCMVDADDDAGVAGWYDSALAAVSEDRERAGWILEFSGPVSDCWDCDAHSIPDERNLYELGWEGEYWDAWITRIHMRYSPDQIDQDLSLYSSGLQNWTRLNWIEHTWEMESTFAVCGEGWVEDSPGNCTDTPPEERGCTAVDRRGRVGVAVFAGLIVFGLRRIRRGALQA